MGAHLHGAAARSVAHRVLEQVGDDLVHAFGIAVDDQSGVVHRDRQLDVGVVELLFADRVAQQWLHRELGAFERHCAGLESREVEQLLDQPPEALHLGEHRGEGVGIGVADAVDEVLELHLQCSDRGAELV